MGEWAMAASTRIGSGEVSTLNQIELRGKKTLNPHVLLQPPPPSASVATVTEFRDTIQENEQLCRADS
ncbi:uncharacterized protein G2W53_014225 [Senna tora]|uniref:Uncharacterized protein n=1 Tax=Senna tora TaxID=362788 RepID=A0A834WT45_9FABA|nr:uncharacterized protein G2W53_014225 [Senna tora]